jgi:hypothetical protein
MLGLGETWAEDNSTFMKEQWDGRAEHSWKVVPFCVAESLDMIGMGVTVAQSFCFVVTEPHITAKKQGFSNWVALHCLSCCKMQHSGDSHKATQEYLKFSERAPHWC